jgi:ferrochelatase
VVLVPIGFVSDHMEVVWDLDTVALDHARTLGLPTERAATVGTDPRFVAMVRELVLERVGLVPARSLSPLGPWPDRCAPGCCANPRGQRPALGDPEPPAAAT